MSNGNRARELAAGLRLTPTHELHGLALADAEATPGAGLPRGEALETALATLLDRLAELQARLYAEGSRALLVVLQARDAAGKDGIVRHVFGACNPAGCHVTPFGAPSTLERRHDFLWRVHANVPAAGIVGVFNRSHYEAVLVERVRELTARDVWAKRYAQINDFERLLTESGVTVLKFFLHVSREEQRKRLLKRLEDPSKNWKFDPGDLADRACWDEYTSAYQDAIARCGTPQAPWFVVPADHKPSARLLVAATVVDALERMDPQYPPPSTEVAPFLEQLR
jgi:PPK2 family polyphosphate:nucleotide phosphotransferase